MSNFISVPYMAYCGEGVFLTRSTNQNKFKQNKWVIFKTKIRNFIRPQKNSIFKIHETNCIKLLNRIRLSFSHLNDHKFRNNCIATITPKCNCTLEPGIIPHYLLRCNLYSDLRKELLNDIWDKVFKSGPSKICGKQPLKNLKGYGLLN